MSKDINDEERFAASYNKRASKFALSNGFNWLFNRLKYDSFYGKSIS